MLVRCYQPGRIYAPPYWDIQGRQISYPNAKDLARANGVTGARPLVEAVGVHALAAERVSADDATVPVLDPDAADKIKTGRL